MRIGASEVYTGLNVLEVPECRAEYSRGSGMYVYVNFDSRLEAKLYFVYVRI
jgi:hypothetical protein